MARIYCKVYSKLLCKEKSPSAIFGQLKEDKKNLCWNTRKQLIDHINSDALKLSSIMKDVKELLKGIIIYNNIFIVIQILTFNKDPYYSGEIETVYNKN